MKTFRIGFIGTGSRASAYAVTLKRSQQIAVEYPALCDTNAGHLAQFNANYCDGKAATYADYEEMLAAHPDLDGIVIATPNYLHEATALAGLRTGAHILLEKPLATTPQACLNIVRASQRYGRVVTLGFVLRYTPLYNKVRELLQQGVCGELLTVSAEEIVHRDVARFFASGWRHSNAASGNMILEKCCHDLDIFHWLLGRLPARVYSFGGTKQFVHIPGSGPNCRECARTAECPYYYDVAAVDAEAARSHEWRYLRTWGDNCAFVGQMELADHQIVGFEYDDGLTLNLTITFGSDLSTRTIRCIGARGRVEGDLATGVVRCGDLQTLATDECTVHDDGSGHHGGDGEICRAFERSLLDPNFRPSSTVEAGFHSAMVAFAAERARLQRRQVEIAELYHELGLQPGTVEALDTAQA